MEKDRYFAPLFWSVDIYFESYENIISEPLSNRFILLLSIQICFYRVRQTYIYFRWKYLQILIRFLNSDE